MEKGSGRKLSKKDKKKDMKNQNAVGRYVAVDAGENELSDPKYKIVWSYAEAAGHSSSLKKSSSARHTRFSTKVIAGTWRFDVSSTSKLLGEKGVLGMGQKVKIDAILTVTDSEGATIANQTGVLDETTRKYRYKFEVADEQAPATVSMIFTSTSVLKGVDVSATLSKKERPLTDIADELNIFPEDMEVLLATFKKYGCGDGLLTFKEFEDAIAEVQTITYKAIFSPTYAKITWELFDADSSGKIDASEFLVGVTVLASGSVEEKAKLSFKAFDKDADGYLSRTELTKQLALASKVSDKIVSHGARSGLGAAGELVAEGRMRLEGSKRSAGLPKEELNRVFSICDTDNDGRISLDEWIEGAKQSQEIRRFFDPVTRFQPVSVQSPRN